MDPDTSTLVRIVALQYNPDLSRALQLRAIKESGDCSQALRLTGPPVETIKREANINLKGQLPVKP